jgi:hypothetical protein
MKRFETIQSPQDEDEIGRGGSSSRKIIEEKKDSDSKNCNEDTDGGVEYSATVESIEDIINSKLEVDSKTERERMMYIFDIRHKHPDSELYYNKRFDEEVLRSRKSQKNVFSTLDEKDLEVDGKIAGKFSVTPDLIPQCTHKPERKDDGKYCLAGDCGWFFQIKIRVSAKDVDLAEAVRAILKAIGNTKDIDYMVIDKGLPLNTSTANGYAIKRNIAVDVSALKNEER